MRTKEMILWKSTELSTSERALLLAIKFHIGSHENTYVSQGILAKEINKTRQTVNKLTQKLESMGWLVVRRRREDHTTNIYSLPRDKFPLFDNKEIAPYVKPVDIPMYNDLTGVCKASLHKVYITKNIENQESKDSCAGEPAQQAIEPNSNKPSGENKDKTNRIIDYNKTTVAILESIWKDEIRRHNPGIKEVLDFTSKERGQLKHFIRKVDPLKDASVVFRAIIKDWNMYSYTVKNDAGICNVPAKPAVWFILKHCEAAINFLIAQEQTLTWAEKLMSIHKALDSSPQMSSEEQLLRKTQIEVVEPPMTWQELMDLEEAEEERQGKLKNGL